MSEAERGILESSGSRGTEVSWQKEAHRGARERVELSRGSPGKLD